MSRADAAARAPATRSTLTIHGDERVDDWYWLRDRDDPEVLAYLEAENAYADGDARAAGAAARPDLRRDQGPGAGDRRVGAGRPTAPWEYYVPHGRRPAVRDPLPATARRHRGRRRGAPRRERARRRTRLLLARRLRGLARPRRARVLGRLHRRRALHAALSRSRRPAPICPTSSRTSPTGSRGPTTRARASTCGPTTRCARTRCGGTSSAPPAADDVLVFREDDERFFVDIERTRSGRFVLIDVVVEADVRDVVRADRRARAEPPRRSRRASTATSTRSSTTGATSGGDRFLIVTNQGGARGTSSSSRRRASIPAREHWTPTRPAPRRRQARQRERVRRPLVLSERADGLDRLAVMRDRRRRHSRDRAARSRLQHVGRRQRRVRHDDVALRLHVARRAADRHRLRHGHAAGDSA